MNKTIIALSGALAFAAFAAGGSFAQAPEHDAGMPEENEARQMDEGAPEPAGDITEQSGGQAGMPGEGAHNPGMSGEKPAGPGGGFARKPHMRMQGGKSGGGGPMLLNEEQALAIIKKHDLAFADKLAGLRGTAPAEHKMALMMAGKMLGAASREKDETLEARAVRELSLEYDTRKLSRGYEKASEAEKAAIKTELNAKVSALFDLRLEGQEARVKRMEKEIAKLRKNIETRRANKNSLVQERVAQLTGEGFGW